MCLYSLRISKRQHSSATRTKLGCNKRLPRREANFAQVISTVNFVENGKRNRTFKYTKSMLKLIRKKINNISFKFTRNNKSRSGVNIFNFRQKQKHVWKDMKYVLGQALFLDRNRHWCECAFCLRKKLFHSTSLDDNRATPIKQKKGSSNEKVCQLVGTTQPSTFYVSRKCRSTKKIHRHVS